MEKKTMLWIVLISTMIHTTSCFVGGGFGGGGFGGGVGLGGFSLTDPRTLHTLSKKQRTVWKPSRRDTERVGKLAEELKGHEQNVKDKIDNGKCSELANSRFGHRVKEVAKALGVMISLGHGTTATTIQKASCGGAIHFASDGKWACTTTTTYGWALEIGAEQWVSIFVTPDVIHGGDAFSFVGSKWSDGLTATSVGLPGGFSASVMHSNSFNAAGLERIENIINNKKQNDSDLLKMSFAGMFATFFQDMKALSYGMSWGFGVGTNLVLPSVDQDWMIDEFVTGCSPGDCDSMPKKQDKFVEMYGDVVCVAHDTITMAMNKVLLFQRGLQMVASPSGGGIVIGGDPTTWFDD